MTLPFPDGSYELFADDDDVIGLTAAKTYPSGWPIVRTDPPTMDAFDEFEVGQFLARCLTNRTAIAALLSRSAAPTRDELAEAVRPWFPYRGDGLDDERVMGAADAALDLFARSAAEPRVGRAVMRGLSIYDEDTGEQLAGPEIDAAERSAAEPPEDRCAVCKGTGRVDKPCSAHDCSTNACLTCKGSGVAAEPNEKATDDG